MNEWTEKPLSPSAIVDDEYLASVAKDLAQNEWTPPPLAPRAPAPRAQHVSKAALDRTISRLCTTLGRGIRQLVVEPLEKRIAELEAQRGLKYVGAWKPGGDYHPGEFVSYAGGIWHCKQHTGTRPNKCHESWQLAVKSGQK